MNGNELVAKSLVNNKSDATRLNGAGFTTPMVASWNPSVAELAFCDGDGNALRPGQVLLALEEYGIELTAFGARCVLPLTHSRASEALQEMDDRQAALERLDMEAIQLYFSAQTTLVLELLRHIHGCGPHHFPEGPPTALHVDVRLSGAQPLLSADELELLQSALAAPAGAKSPTAQHAKARLEELVLPTSSTVLASEAHRLALALTLLLSQPALDKVTCSLVKEPKARFVSGIKGGRVVKASASPAPPRKGVWHPRELHAHAHAGMRLLVHGPQLCPPKSPGDVSAAVIKSAQRSVDGVQQVEQLVTVQNVNADGSLFVVADNDPQHGTLQIPGEDGSGDVGAPSAKFTCRHAPTYHYTSGRRVMVLRDVESTSCKLADFEVIEWRGLREGSCHDVKLTGELPVVWQADGDGTMNGRLLPASYETATGSAPVRVDLHELNHAVQLFKDAEEFEKARQQYCDCVREDVKELEDAITGNKLGTEKQVLNLEMEINTDNAANKKRKTDSRFTEQMKSVKNLAALLAERSVRRLFGGHEERKPVLICAGPGTGKTWSMQQLLYFLATDCHSSTTPPLAPMVLYVQRLANLMRDAKTKSGADQYQLNGNGIDLLLLYIRKTFQEAWQRDLLYMAVGMRTLVLLIDGIDEASDVKEQVHEFILGLLALRFRLVITSREEGVEQAINDHKFDE